MLSGRFPPPLKPNDRIMIVSPAGPVDREPLYRGVERLQSRGYKVELAPHVLTRQGFLAGADDDRLSDLVDALTNPDISGVICSRGGYGSGRLLDRIPFDLLRTAAPKAFVGFSDIGVLQLALLSQSGWVTFSGPQAAMGLGGDISDRTVEHLLGMLDGSNVSTAWVNGQTVELTPLRGDYAEGVLVPCCLSMLVSLIGTGFLPDLKDAVLCVEDINEPLYRIDRMMWQLKTSGVIDHISALVIGRFISNSSDISDYVNTVVLDLFCDYSFPVWTDLPYGHVKDRLTLPVGASVSVERSGGMTIFTGNPI